MRVVAIIGNLALLVVSAFCAYVCIAAYSGHESRASHMAWIVTMTVCGHPSVVSVYVVVPLLSIVALLRRGGGPRGNLITLWLRRKVLEERNKIEQLSEKGVAEAD